MRKIVWIAMIVSAKFACAQFIGIEDKVTNNRFLGQGISACGIHSGKVGGKFYAAYQHAYDCGNTAVSDVLGVNLVSEGVRGQQFYLFNNFAYWIGQKSHASTYDEQDLKYTGSDLTNKLNKDFPATWMYMIVFGTSNYLKQIVAPTVTCPSGKTLVAGQLKYNNGSQIHTWSQAHVCLAPTDTFILQITSDADGTVPAEKTDTSDDSTGSSNSVNWMKDPGPSSDYQQATNCPRSIKFVVQS